MSGTSPLASTQEEADARLLFHASHALIIHATDSDVIVIAINSVVDAIDAVDAIKSAEDIGKAQYHKFL